MRVSVFEMQRCMFEGGWAKLFPLNARLLNPALHILYSSLKVLDAESCLFVATFNVGDASLAVGGSRLKAGGSTGKVDPTFG